MMGKHEPQKDLFSYGVDLDKRVRKDHPLRKVSELVDFSFVRNEVEDKYGINGNESVDPEIIMKLIFLLFWDNIRSERELMRMLPERLDYLWFLGYGLDDEVPDHSVLSKARRRWGAEVFESLFVRSVHQCMEAGVITATETTPGDVGENKRMKPLIEQHQHNVGAKPHTAIADSQYGTAENYRDITAMEISTHVRPYARKKRGELYGKEKFRYDPSMDTYECPAGQRLYPRSFDKIRWAMEYVVRKGTCNDCLLKSQCTRAKTGRTVLRRWAQELIDEGIAASETQEAANDLKRRMWLIEGSFAQAANLHGFKRSRWRRLHRQRIQDWIICGVQNIKLLITHAKTPHPGAESVIYTMIGIQQLDTILNRLLSALMHHPFNITKNT